MTKVLLAATLLALVTLFWGCRSLERKLLCFPTHRSSNGALKSWSMEEEPIGFSRAVEQPKNVWLLLHGNGGQAIDRIYALPCFSSEDSVYILEYPGYGERAGSPSEESFNSAAKEAYRWLRSEFKGLPICVVGESIGTGPASYLGSLDGPPDKIVLITPYDRLSLVAEEQFPKWLVSLALKSNWDNSKALSRYRGPIEIFGAVEDRIIPVKHARSLASKLPNSTFNFIEGGHNDWSKEGRVSIRNP